MPPSARSSSMSWNQTPALSLRFDVIGAFVHHAKAHVFQHRHAFGQRQRPRETPHFQADGALLFFEAVMKVDAERTLF